MTVKFSTHIPPALLLPSQKFTPKKQSILGLGMHLLSYDNLHVRYFSVDTPVKIYLGRKQGFVTTIYEIDGVKYTQI